MTEKEKIQEKIDRQSQKIDDLSRHKVTLASYYGELKASLIIMGERRKKEELEKLLKEAQSENKI